MRLHMRDLVAGCGRNRLQRADLVGDEVLDLRRLQAWDRPPPEAVQVAISRMRADADAARFRQFNRAAHDVSIAGMEAAGDVHRRRQLDHRGVIAHFPRAKSFAEIAIEIDGCHDAGPLLVSGLV